MIDIDLKECSFRGFEGECKNLYNWQGLITKELEAVFPELKNSQKIIVAENMRLIYEGVERLEWEARVLRDSAYYSGKMKSVFGVKGNPWI